MARNPLPQAGLKFVSTLMLVARGLTMDTLDIAHPAGLVNEVRLAAATLVELVMREGSVNDQLNAPTEVPLALKL